MQTRQHYFSCHAYVKKAIQTDSDARRVVMRIGKPNALTYHDKGWENFASAMPSSFLSIRDLKD